MTHLVLVPSPFLGATTWQPTADVLAGRGHQVTVVAWERPPSTPLDVVDMVLAAVGPARDVVLVPHSNAGLHAPVIAAEVAARATVYVDAALASDTDAEVALAPPDLAARVVALADADGMLPPWTDWWDETDLAPLLPDAESRARVTADQHRLPSSYLLAQVAVPQGWADRPCAYLALGDTYADERSWAERRRWPTGRLDGRHLQMVHDPASVATAILDLVSELAGRPHQRLPADADADADAERSAASSGAGDPQPGGEVGRSGGPQPSPGSAGTSSGRLK